MNSAAFKSPPCFAFAGLSGSTSNRNLLETHQLRVNILRNRSKHYLVCKRNLNSCHLCEMPRRSSLCFEVETAAAPELAGDRLRRLVTEFESLKEPIDRVKRLLDCADRLPPFDESSRLPENRVTGCTTQVWLEARMDGSGRMRFRADSDSEITKGFISCLIWLFDGAEPEEVVGVKAEDLAALNVGLYGKAKSRVNTWHNVLTAMQNRTKALVAERSLDPLPPLILAADNGIQAEAQVAKFSNLTVSADYT